VDACGLIWHIWKDRQALSRIEEKLAMNRYLINRWIQLVVVAAITAAVGALLAVNLSGGSETSAPVLGPVKLTTGGAVQRGGEGWLSTTSGLTGDRVVLDLVQPLTGAEAVAQGWKDPVLCSQGRGKYYEKIAQDVPYFLMYDSADDLIGIYQFTTNEMPPPWELTEVVYGGAGPVIEYEHWGLFIYFRDSTRACDTQESKAGAEVTSAFK
jgi:hypothetical protein